MANQEHLDILRQGVEVWNLWRKEHPEIQPDLRSGHLSSANLEGANLNKANFEGADLREANLNRTPLREATLSWAKLRGAHLIWADLSEANLYRVDLSKADLHGAIFTGADLREANLNQANLKDAWLSTVRLNRADIREADLKNASLHEADLNEARLNRSDLSRANLRGAHLILTNIFNADLNEANLTEADLTNADLHGANLSRADLTRANLSGANLNDANLEGADLSETTLIKTTMLRANLTGCFIYGIAAWNVKLEGATQSNLIITERVWEKPIITVDNLKVAQFIHLLLNNKEIRDVIDTITSKVVLILGRFTEERKEVLDALRDELRKQNYLPVLFDFEKPASQDLTETVSTLAHLARFIIVDLTDPSSVPHEVAIIIPQTIVPVQPLLTLQALMVEGKAVERHEYAMFEDLRRRYHWVLPTFRYQNTADLLASLEEHIIAPAELKAQELEKR